MKDKLLKGIDAYQMKIFALVFMTLDHITVYLTEISFINANGGIIRILGRIAAPLFLFMIVQGLYHTRSKERYAFRLYIVSLVMEVLDALVSIIPSEMQFMSPKDNIFATFFYVVFYVILIEKIIEANKEKNIKKGVYSFVLILISFSFAWIEMFVYNYIGVTDISRTLLISATSALFPNPFGVEYSFIFIILGIAWYFIGNKKIQCVLFAFLCIASCLLVGVIPVSFHFPFYELFVPHQFWMFLSLPFIYLYNNQKGKSDKYFFYMYYPLHIYALYIIGSILMIN